MRNSILVRGARENNLKNVDIEIPRDSLCVFTGLSGSDGGAMLSRFPHMCGNSWDKWTSRMWI